jgi:hypothetical protein
VKISDFAHTQKKKEKKGNILFCCNITFSFEKYYQIFERIFFLGKYFHHIWSPILVW